LNIVRFRRVVAIWVLCFGILGLLYIRAVEAVRGGDRRIGVQTDRGEKGLSVLSILPGLPAERAGLRVGDEILTVGGRPVRTAAELQGIAAEFRRGTPVEFRVRRQGAVRVIAVSPGTRLAWAPFALDALTAFCYLGIALLALAHRKQGGPARQAVGDPRPVLLFAFSLAVAVELSLPLPGSAGTLWLRPVYRAAFYLLTGLQMGLELHLASLIPERPDWLRRRRRLVPLYYAAGLGLGMVTCAAFLGEEVLGLQLFPWNADAIAGFLGDFGLPAWAVAVSVLLVAQALRHPEPAGRHQAGLVLAGIFPWFLWLLATSVLTRLGWTLPATAESLETLILLCYPLALFAAIYRYQLFDIELVVRRSLVYSVLTGALILVFYAVLGAGGFLFSQLVAGGERSVWVVSASTLLLGLLVSPLRRAVQRIIDRRFFPERQALRQSLIALAGKLPALGKLPRMGRHLVESLTGAFGARSALLLIANPETRLLGVLASTGEERTETPLFSLEDPAVEFLREAQRPVALSQIAARSPAFAHRLPTFDAAGLAVPLVSQERLIGVLLVGRKEGRRSYPAEEVDLLNLLAHHVATVFENARLFESATYEGLTGLLRREAVLEQLDKELERALRYGRPLTVAMADIDHFKRVNDHYGHLAGDSLLRRVSQVAAGSLRGTDWIGRYGGEELLLVLPETDLEGAAVLAEKIRGLVQRTWISTEEGDIVRATLSIGLASLAEVREERGEEARITARDLIAAADRALYEAKNGGRNRVHPLGAAA
jgi:diguanylate cyclase (GGDEF)-like protein